MGIHKKSCLCEKCMIKKNVNPELPSKKEAEDKIKEELPSKSDMIDER